MLYSNRNNWISVEGHLDTKADANIASQILVNLLGHALSSYQGQNFQAVSGPVTPRGKVEIFFRLEESQKIHYEEFLVLEDPPFDLILGISFIKKYRVYKFNGSLLPLALTPESKGNIYTPGIAPLLLTYFNAEEKAQIVARTAKLEERRRKEEERERNKKREEREKQRQLLQSKVPGVVGKCENSGS